jgi:CelD/BcsL family acetyltransferase involved in cellulose biosynthesis
MKLTLHRTFPEDLHAAWNDLLSKSTTHVPFLRYEYPKDWWATRGGGEWQQADLLIVTAHEGDTLVGVAPLFFTTQTEKPSLLLVGAVEISDYLDIIALPGKLNPFLAALLDFLEELDLPWQELVLHNLLDDSPSLPALQALAGRLGKECRVEVLQRSPYIPLPTDWETYLAGVDKKQRHEIRRKMRRAAELEVPASLHIVEDAASLDAEIEAFLGLMAQDEAKARFLTGPMREQMRQTMRMAFTCGCLNLAFLQFGNEKAAAYLSFDYLNRIWVYNSGFNPRYFETSPGWVLLGHMIQWAISNGREALDFMRGDEEYKYRFGAVDRHVVKATLIR